MLDTGFIEMNKAKSPPSRIPKGGRRGRADNKQNHATRLLQGSVQGDVGMRRELTALHGGGGDGHETFYHKIIQS